MCQFYILKPIDFIQTYSFSILARILLKFCNNVGLWCLSLLKGVHLTSTHLRISQFRQQRKNWAFIIRLSNIVDLPLHWLQLRLENVFLNINSSQNSYIWQFFSLFLPNPNKLIFPIKFPFVNHFHLFYESEPWDENGPYIRRFSF